MKFFKLRNLMVSGVALFLALASPVSTANLELFAGYQDAALSIDAATDNTSVSGVLEVEAAAVNETVIAAFLYVASVWTGPAPNVTLNGTSLAAADGTLLTPNDNPANTVRHDVTSIVKADIEGGTSSFSYSEQSRGDGAVLVVAYSSAATQGSTAIILDGELALGGDSTTLNFAEAYSGGDVIMSLASSFSYQGSNNQSTIVDVTTDSTDNRRLTSSAGGNDDGGLIAADGQLITAGGFGDDPTNPDPFATPPSPDENPDDELYNLALGNSEDATPFLQNGDTFIRFDTENPSNDDNVFALFFTTAFAVTDVDDTPICDPATDPNQCEPDDDPAPVPEPSTMFLFGIGFLGAALIRRRRIV